MERPKHLADGLGKGTTCVAAGVGAGVATLVACPVQGMKQKGALGAAGGAVLGAGGFVVFSILGVGAGVVQVVRGACNTPEAVNAKLKGKEWDRRTHRWLIYNLKEEIGLVLNMDEVAYYQYMSSEGKVPPSARRGNEEAEAKPHRDVKETGLYDALGVQPDATSAQIKKAYYKMAKQHHPDKNDGSEGAKQRFQEISDAYQILMDDDARERYDKYGKAGVAEQPKMDAKQFYAQMFGSEEFEPLIGKINFMPDVDEDELDVPDGMDPELFQGLHEQLQQWKREVTCASNLLDLIKLFADEEAPEEEFRSRIQQLGTELASSAVGGALLAFIGDCYRQFAKMALGTHAVSGSVSNRIRGAATYAAHKKTVVSAWGSLAKAGASTQVGDKGEATELAARQADGVMRVMWHATRIEIEGLLKQVCFKVTHDQSVTKLQRQRRAEALIIVGDVFVSLGATGAEGLAALTERLGPMVNPTGDADGDEADEA